ncbi:Crp/Fnr family transcriptional regulator [Flavobacterium selenitireducens]|uniref:Crp/Fnr family transcriptional regulator n=1 Tax=Flavobacterium selenitireducens TaxID=2722704 RepID=UPI00168BD17E|nr:Crp/Fnr family transcriptional regulator [Flavobacterium selenitireducens]MBD3582876.1 Crp/Fnr family transcriptional regulator [Flavobacterium selenitireducens]
MQNLLEHIDKFVSLDESEKELLLSRISYVEARKKQFLLEAGKPGYKLFFVLKGCLRLYLITPKGNEQTHQFVIENWWMTDYLAFHNDSVSGFYVQAVERSEVAVLQKSDMDFLLEKIPKLERYFRLCYQKAVGAAQKRISYLFSLSAEERFHNMNDKFPEFVQRVPQYMLASYLDFSAEFLSKIRAGKV